MRADLKMPQGKACSQAGHAYLMSFLAADETRRKAFHSDGLGTKICLSASSEQQLLELRDLAHSLSLPHYLVEDTGRNTTFGGVPTISALGIGPVLKAEVPFLKRYSLLS